uniref:TLDc domain-containing protein n=1 Tax=Oncorhynchus tshawytscha TaxID=74940 RepID=A0A8C8ICP5_ONCTS
MKGRRQVEEGFLSLETIETWIVYVCHSEGECIFAYLFAPSVSLSLTRHSILLLHPSIFLQLSVELPPRTVGHTWQLAYSTSRHGSSLKSLYRRLKGSDSPILMVIKDSLNQVFGSFLSHPLRPSETFYGTGETFLFIWSFPAITASTLLGRQSH